MAGLVPALAVFAALVGIFMLIIPGLRRRGYRPKTWRGVAGLHDPGAAGGFPAGLVAAVAFVSTLEVFGVEGVAPMAIGSAGVAVLAAWGRRTAQIVFAVIGVAGSVATVVSLFAPILARTPRAPRCVAAHDQWSLVIAVTVLLVTSLVAYGFAVVVWRRRPGAMSLVVFALLDITVFFADPLGLPLVTQSQWYIVPALLVIVAFAVAGAAFPAIVLGLGALGVSMATIMAAAGWGTACEATSQWSSLTGLVVFGVVYAIARRFAAR